MQNSIAIVGCGISGISASIELIKRKINHTIFEARNTIGGRFYSFYDPEFDIELDNGQHLFSSVYTNFFSILDFLDSKKHLSNSNSLEIYFYAEKNQKFCLKKSIFSGKTGIINGILNLKSLAFSSRINLLRLLFDFLFNTNKLTSKKICAYDLLMMKNQNEELIIKFWEPVCVSIFNNHLHKIPADLFVRTIKLAFLSDENPVGFFYSKVPQSQLLSKYLEIANGNNVELYLSTPIRYLQATNDGFILTAKNGKEFKFRYVILCVQPNILKKLLPTTFSQLPEFQFLQNVCFNPILSIYFTTEDPIISEPYGFLLKSPIHWIFNKNVMLNVFKPINFYSITISNSKDLINKSNEEIIKVVNTEIQKYFHNIPEILFWKVIKDKFATVDINLDFNELRPNQETSIPGLYLAGDWTDTKLPATLESAALSGKLAVEKLLNNFG